MRRLLLALFVLTGCSDPLLPAADGGPVSSSQCFGPPDGGVFLSGLSAPVPGCALPAPDSGVFKLSTLDAIADGVLVIPPAADGTALPVVFAFHGAYETGAVAQEEFDLEGAADGGAIVVYPTASQGAWDIRPDSRDGLKLDRLLRSLSEAYCIDPRRIYIAGFSSGAVYTLWLGCNVPATFRALVAVAGTDTRFDLNCCKGSISGMSIHGTLDDSIPYSEGVEANNYVLVRDGCSTASTPDGAHCAAYTCPAPYAVDFCSWNGTHQVPDWAGAETWRFFDSQR